jgi:hypothetical protein
MWSGEDTAFVVRLKVATRDPAPLGVNRNEYVQLAFTANVPPHVVELEKSAAFVPVIVADEIVSDAVPTFCKITVCEFDCVATV